MGKEEGIYARAADKLREKKHLLKGQWFFKSDACEVCSVNSKPGHQEYRDAIGQVLYNWTHYLIEPILEQRDKKYRFINRDFKVVRPGQTSSKFDMKWPVGADGSTYRFDESIIVTKGDVMGLGGEGNKGKSVFALDLVVANMDIHDVTLVLSENVQRLDERLSHFTWADIYKPNGDWKFEVLDAKGADEFIDIARNRKNNLIVFD